ncbi:MAG: bifunctional phosphopantothenoylcysteine decarboxylase/phosphopantothenate--cysteine ligase CoaBC [Proteobacteria bacterium]|nr:bifunctional phosphopantothenoylcysteine decarboxylase/phosphopantothenate--cysteine ligase CoaBC [Pseudomonadota bacterium]
MDLKGKRIILGVTGSISAYKSATIASKLTQMGALVDVIMTENATKLVGPATFEGLTHRRCHTDTFADCADLEQSHVTLGSHADLVVIAPCSANMLAKIAHGIADDKLSTTMLAVRCPVILAPAMNCFMYANEATQANIKIVESRGMLVMEPETGNLACGYTAKGRMPEPEQILEIIMQYLALPHTLKGKKVIVTAGATREAVDDVRCISNPSTGKMGYACARAAKMAGADVVIVSAPTALKAPDGIRVIDVKSAQDMAEAVFAEAEDADIVIMAAAVADFTPEIPRQGKIHKEDADLVIRLKRTTDILKKLGENKRPGQILCGFSMETENHVERAEFKLKEKNVDMIVSNDLTSPGCGFAVDTNGVTIVTASEKIEIGVADKIDIAVEIIRKLSELIQ